MSALPLREPVLEWAVRSARGRLDRLRWVDTRLDPTLPPYRVMSDDDREAFRHLPYLAFLPPAIAREAVSAQARGQATAWEALVLLFARPEWLVAARGSLWTSHAPVPKLLKRLVERFGIEAPLHGDNPERLLRLMGSLRTWHPARGRVDRAADVLAACDEGRQTAAVLTGDVDLEHELFTCKPLSWWEARADQHAKPVYRISGGYLRFQPEGPARYRNRTEDVALSVDPGTDLPRGLFRLLPVWAVIRPVHKHEETE